MKQDLEQFQQAKEYIDTLLIPLIPMDPSNEELMIKQAVQNELTQLFCREIENECKGRLLLTPLYTYLSGDEEGEAERLNRWISKFKSQPFQHVFLFTMDSKWKKYEKNVDADLIWVPAMGTSDLNSTATQSFVKEQVREITGLIQSYW
ncbi:DUF2487 family protein [Thalassobacillus hwangdonensis]|uniref:DUF2487 family protein n=2 Tax=Thalassobacillus hwangdonensis TaxID=546108 RepID=A0ABW3KZD2_9BACI